MKKFYRNQRIKVDGEITYLLDSNVCDNGIILTISGPDVIYLHEHEVSGENDEDISDILSKGERIDE